MNTNIGNITRYQSKIVFYLYRRRYKDETTFTVKEFIYCLESLDSQ